MVQSETHEHVWDFKSCALIVAHPDDEILWAGGTILMHPDCNWTVAALCRASDADRCAKFFQVVEHLNVSGQMGDLDDGPEQTPLDNLEVQSTILSLLPSDRFDLIITHTLCGEYTRHLRHEETGQAVRVLWESGRLSAEEMWMFAYEDGQGKYLPRAMEGADIFTVVPEELWQQKYGIITGIYGFERDSFEAKSTPRQEAFWRFKSSGEVKNRLNKRV